MDEKQVFRLEGFAEFEEQLKDLAEGYRSDLVARNTLVRAAKVAMEPVYAAVAQNAPYDNDRKSNVDSEGRLKPHMRETVRLDSRIVNEKDRQSGYITDTDSVIAVVSVKKSAASLSQEHGNARVAAQPFLAVSLESNIPKVLTKLKSELSYIIPAYAKKLQKRGIKK